MVATKEKAPRPEKVDEIEFLRDVLSTCKGAVVADYRGINVKNLQTLRKRLRECDGSFRVVKNTLVKRAAKDLPAYEMVKDLEGPTGLAYTTGDPAATAKALMQFVKEFKLLKIKGGIADGFVLTPEQLVGLAALPPRQVLIGQVVGGLQAPVAGLVSTMQQLYSGIVFTLQGIAEKKG